MKAMVCELCGGNQFVKQDGMFVCQHCNTKYTVEEAKKLIVEGTVKIDDTDELKNLYDLARRAKDDNNSENAQKYYEQILVKDPSSWEASFYSVYFQAMNCKILEIQSSAVRLSNSEESVLKLIKRINDENEQKRAVEEFASRIIIISEMFFTSYRDYYNNLSIQVKADFLGGYVAGSLEAAKVAYNAGNGITNFFEDKYGIIAAQCWKQGVRVHSEICGLFDDKQTHASVIKQAHEQIKKYEPSYQPPEIDMSKSGACYVATAVYGSYDCPQVWTLRRYRDDTLSKTWYGRAFIRTYYSISPKLVKWFGNKRWFNRFLKPKLDRMVNYLNNKGYSQKPYYDK